MLSAIHIPKHRLILLAFRTFSAKLCDAVTSSPALVFTAALILAAVPPTAQGRHGSSSPPGVREYYVSFAGNDKNNGSRSHPWKTINHADAAILLGKNGTVVHVAPGEYHLRAVMCNANSVGVCTRKSGKAAARIVYRSDTRWGAKLYFGGAHAVWSSWGDFVDIEGFEVSSEYLSDHIPNPRIGIQLSGNYDRASNNHIHHIYAPLACGHLVPSLAAGGDNNGGAGISVFGAEGIVSQTAHDVEILDNVIHDIGFGTAFTGMETCPETHGVYTTGPALGGGTGGHICGNLIYHNQGWGIHMWAQSNHWVVANNTLLRNGWGGILVGNGQAPAVCKANPGCVQKNDYTLVANNICRGNGWRGQHGCIYEYGSTGTHNLYTDNLYYQDEGPEISLRNGLLPQGSINADPQFINYVPNGTGDYHLKPTSPAREAGSYDCGGIDGGHQLSLSQQTARKKNRDLGAFQYNVH